MTLASRVLVLPLAMLIAGFSHAALADDSPEELAAQATQVPGLRLLPPVQGVTIGYVDEDVATDAGKYNCGGATRIAAEAAAQQVDMALAKVAAVIPVLRLRYVVICGSTSKSGNPVGGVPVTARDMLMLGIADSKLGTEAQQNATLHELFQLSEYRLGGTDDPDWNDHFAGYDKKDSPRWRESGIGGGGTGFLNAYSRSYAREERAGLFAALVLKPRELSRYIGVNDDEILRNKADYVAGRANRLLGLSLGLE